MGDTGKKRTSSTSNAKGSRNRASAKSGNSRKSSAKRTSPKKRSASKRKNKKVFIPADKIILFCGCIVLVCAILLITTQAIDSRKRAEIKNEFEKITEQKIDTIDDVAIEKSTKITKGKNDSFKDSQKKTTSSPKETDKSSIQQKSSPNFQKTDSPSQKSTGQQNNKSSQAEKKAVSSASKEKLAMAKNPDNKAVDSDKTVIESNNKVGEQEKKVVKNDNKVISDNKAVIEPVVPKGAQAITSTNDEFSFITPAKNNAVLVFVFDDGGQNLSQLEKVLALPFPITVAVLPGLAHSAEAAEKVRQSGNEVILHQPMQAVNLNVNPGPGAITPSMSEDEIRSVLFKNIYEIAPIKGINNHEGSLITSDAEKMSYVMKLLSDEGLYFLDSRTNADTQVPFVAKSLGYSYYERNVFLDNTKVRADILGEIKKGLDYSNKTGCAIMIGHVWSAEILPGILKELYPLLVKNGYRFSTVSNCPAKIN